MLSSETFVVLPVEDKMWTLTDALGFCHNLLHVVKPTGYYLGLTGGCLREGSSNHDIDIILYPLQAGTDTLANLAAVKQAMFDFGMRPKYHRDVVQAAWRRKGSMDEKWVEIWTYNGKRVDVFFLR